MSRTGDSLSNIPSNQRWLRNIPATARRMVAPLGTISIHHTCAGRRRYELRVRPRPALPLHPDAGGTADFDSDAARAGSIGIVHSLRNDALGTEPARLGEHGRPILDTVFVKQDCLPWCFAARASPPVQEREIAQILAIMFDQVEGAVRAASRRRNSSNRDKPRSQPPCCQS
jgi:hypothetical protein